MDVTFIYLMFVLKIPIVALLWLVWWAVHAEPDEVEGGGSDDGGSKRPRHPRPRHPRRPRRGPHGEPAVPAPPRTRTTVRSHSTTGA